MKKTLRFVAMLLAVVMLFTTVFATLIACGDENPSDTDAPQHEHTFSSIWLYDETHHWHEATCEHKSEVGSKAEHTLSNGKCTTCEYEKPVTQTADYTVTVTTIAGMPLKAISVFAVDETGALVGAAETNADGVAVLKGLPTNKTYTAKLMSEPEGYKKNEDGYRLLGLSTPIILESGIIAADSESDYASKRYALGDIMYDFSFTTIEGKSIRLSKLFEEGKKGVLINFWFSSCSPCRAEFPHMQSVYERYSDEISIVAINPTGENDMTLKGFAQELGLTFDIVNGGATLAQCFNISAYPTSIFVDKYGTITFFIPGSLPSERPFEALFSKAVADDYKQVIYETVDELLPKEECNIEMESSETVGGVLNSGDIQVTYYPERETADWKYSWPFKTTVKDGVPCVVPTNSFKDESFATMHADVYLEAGQALLFDYWASSEIGVDILFVLVDGVDIATISGVSTSWATCCAYVALEAGTYKVSFLYNKDDSDNVGDDAVYMKNLRIASADDVDTPSYIQREAATKPYANGDGFENYVDIVLGDDGYFHVGSKTGPLLLADLMGFTNFSREDSIYTLISNGEVVKDGHNYYNEIIKYCSYAGNSSIYGLCTVNKELQELLKAVSEICGDGLYNSNDWLEICKYYDAYGTDGKQLEDPIKGLAPHSAFKAAENTESDADDYYPNKVVYDRLIMPRGLLYEFVPTKSGVYRVTSNSISEVDGWIFDEDHNELLVYDHVERFLTTNMSNVSMVWYMEAGEKYYIDIAFHEVTEMGSFTFKVEYVADSYTMFAAASPGFFTYELDENGELTNELIAGGIEVALGEDSLYHHVLDDKGTLGSIVYVDFTMYTNLFPTGAIYNAQNPAGASLINQGAFDFSKNETDRDAIINGYDKMTDEQLLALWGEELYASNYEFYKIDDLRRNIYHGSGEDYTERMIEIAETKMLNDTNCEDINLYGCVAVDEELATILQALVDHTSFSNVRNSWTKLCYYYRYFGPDMKA